MNNELFRKESVDRVSTPEQLNDYIKVVSPGIWILLFAIIILLVGIIVWAVVSSVVLNDPQGVATLIKPSTLVTN